MSSMLNIFRAALGSVLILGCMTAHAQEWPPKQIKIVVPFPPGGSTDSIARYLGKGIQSAINAPVVVENISGGGGIVGMQAVLKAPADGATLLFTGSGNLTVLQHTNPQLPFDPLSVLQPITFVNTLPHWLIVKADRPQNSLQDLIEVIRKNPGTVNISVNAVGGVAHLALLSWAKKNNLDFAIIPYRGSPPAMIDLLGGVTTAHVDVVGSSISFVKSGRAKPLGVLQETPLIDFPNVLPSLPESSGGLVVHGQHVLAVRQGTSAEITNRIYALTKSVVNKPEFIDFLKNLGYEKSTPTPEESRQILDKESKSYGEIVRQSHLKFN